MGQIVSIQVGTVRQYTRLTSDGRKVPWETAFDKQQISRDVTVEALGLVGDAQADTKNHGGPDKAVLLYAHKHYAPWQASYPELALNPGAFGENFTVEGMDEDSVCIGDVYQVGDVIIEISQPRIPCWKISERWGEPTLTDAVRSSGKTGWYARVLQSGTVAADGQPRLTLLERPYPSFTIRQLNDVINDRGDATPDYLEGLRTCPKLAASFKAAIPSV